MIKKFLAQLILFTGLLGLIYAGVYAYHNHKTQEQQQHLIRKLNDQWQQYSHGMQQLARLLDTLDDPTHIAQVLKYFQCYQLLFIAPQDIPISPYEIRWKPHLSTQHVSSNHGIMTCSQEDSPAEIFKLTILSPKQGQVTLLFQRDLLEAWLQQPPVMPKNPTESNSMTSIVSKMRLALTPKPITFASVWQLVLIIGGIFYAVILLGQYLYQRLKHQQHQYQRLSKIVRHHETLLHKVTKNPICQHWQQPHHNTQHQDRLSLTQWSTQLQMLMALMQEDKALTLNIQTQEKSQQHYHFSLPITVVCLALLKNAMHFSPKQAKITCSIVLEASHLTLTLCDQGYNIGVKTECTILGGISCNLTDIQNFCLELGGHCRFIPQQHAQGRVIELSLPLSTHKSHSHTVVTLFNDG